MFMENESQYSLNAKFDFVVALYNDIAAVDAALSALPPDSLAAILVEPVQVSGGCIPGTRRSYNTYTKLQPLTRRY